MKDDWSKATGAESELSVHWQGDDDDGMTTQKTEGGMTEGGLWRSGLITCRCGVRVPAVLGEPTQCSACKLTLTVKRLRLRPADPD